MCVHVVPLLFVLCLVMQFDWVYVTGDLPPHNVWNQTCEDQVRETCRIWRDGFVHYFLYLEKA